MLVSRDSSVVLVVDMQARFGMSCLGWAEVLGRVGFVAECAGVLGVPVLATEQVPGKMGGTEAGLAGFLSQPAFGKTAFSCWGCRELVQAVEALGARQLVLVGIETHICVAQTALEALEAGLDVFLPLDAVTSRSAGATEAAVRRLRDAGVWVTHSESVVYEWVRDAEEPRFREVLGVVKRAAGGLV